MAVCCLLYDENQKQNKHVESLRIACLDEGSNPSNSTKNPVNYWFSGFLFIGASLGAILYFVPDLSTFSINEFLNIINETENTYSTLIKEISKWKYCENLQLSIRNW